MEALKGPGNAPGPQPNFVAPSFKGCDGAGLRGAGGGAPRASRVSGVGAQACLSPQAKKRFLFNSKEPIEAEAVTLGPGPLKFPSVICGEQAPQGAGAAAEAGREDEVVPWLPRAPVFAE